MFTSLSHRYIGLACIVASTQGFAADAPSAMSKDEWLGKLKSIAPVIICKGFFEDEGLKKRLTDLKIDYEKCTVLIPSSYDKCQKKYYEQLPSSITQENGSKWGRTLGECIGADFMLNNMAGAEAGASKQDNSSSSAAPAPSSGASNSSPTNTSADSKHQDIPKDKWLSDLKTVAPQMICKGFLEDAVLKEKFKEKSIDMDKCVSLLPASFDKCQNKVYSQLPATINDESASKWGYKIGECIGGDFVRKNILGQ